MAFAFKSIFGRKFDVLALVLDSAASSLLSASEIKKLFSIPFSTSSETPSRSTTDLKSSFKGLINLTSLPTMAFNSSNAISTLPSARTLSEIALFKAAFASANSILEAAPASNLSLISSN